ncbi:MAG: single-stranded DNA-binding protein [Roseburia sp.]|nr:single-stranded DNA-binding protein [Roseburia sp.]
MNKVILLGNLTRDPEVRYTQGENSMAIANFTLAVNRRYFRQGDADCDFFNCTAFGKQAEFVEKYFNQGSRMLLTGRIQNNNYTNKKGEKVYSVQIMAEDVEFGSTKGSSTPSDKNVNRGIEDDFTNIPDDTLPELPFN